MPYPRRTKRGLLSPSVESLAHGSPAAPPAVLAACELGDCAPAAALDARNYAGVAPMPGTSRPRQAPDSAAHEPLPRGLSHSPPGHLYPCSCPSCRQRLSNFPQRLPSGYPPLQLPAAPPPAARPSAWPAGPPSPSRPCTCMQRQQSVPHCTAHGSSSLGAWATRRGLPRFAPTPADLKPHMLAVPPQTPQRPPNLGRFAPVQVVSWPEPAIDAGDHLLVAGSVFGLHAQTYNARPSGHSKPSQASRCRIAPPAWL